MGHFLQKESWSFALLATSKRRGGLYFVNFQMTGVCCAFVIPKKTKTVLESMRGRTGGSLLPLLFLFLSPATPFSLLLLFSFWLCLLSPSFSPTFLPPLSILPPSPFSHPCLPSLFPPHLCGHDCCEYHTHICVAQGWKFNILVAQCYTCIILYDQARMLKK